MNDVLKQRLVGALILLALGVVFWPIIFVEPGDQAGDERAGIPPRPAVDTTPVMPPDMAGLRASPEIAVTETPSPEQVEPVEVPVEEAAPVETESPPAAPAPAPEPVERTRTQAPERPAVDSDGIPVAWMLQVVSVSSPDKADQLRQRLLDMDHKAYVKRVKVGDKSLYRVYVGPKFERARLEEIKSDIDAEFGVKSMIVRYVP